MKPASATTSARVALDALGQRGVEGVARREGAVVDDLGGDAVLARERQAGGVGAVADDRGDARVPALVGAGAHDRLHVGAATRDQDDDVLHRRAQCIGARRARYLQSSRFCRPAVDERSIPRAERPGAVRQRRRGRDLAPPRPLRHAPDRRDAPRPLPRRAQELGAPAGRVRVLLLRRRLARADDALRRARGDRELGLRHGHRLARRRPRPRQGARSSSRAACPSTPSCSRCWRWARRSAGSSACRPTRTRSSSSRTATSRPTASSATRCCRRPTS